ncbi:monovalent cation/H+ antiporter subunit D [Arsenicitalea aurantiaca]|uniref:Monovalent cation/H+ antiporter subunit D n=1 Tax=Arsenicitalea aurantiaca TaxID=1783274 RepID=A0A433XEQ2_9HYPH|nr:monovalent cation/H+ antiporter subunit D [Arsenicitalea aurantiaca]RUT32579.1 monovalent cation/H+ antiporter subunit D [Arsenicitalea aurantiaca]
MGALFDHLIAVPILLPLLAGALMVIVDDRRRPFKIAVNLVSTLTLLIVAITLLMIAGGMTASGDPARTSVYLLGNWPAPFAITLVLDRLSALMLVLTSVLAVAALIFSLARWHRAGPHFHTLFQFLLVGINGAFLTGDLFNLFVFFEVMLAASYGLVLHGSGTARVRAGLHYIAINLSASLLFLIGVALIYGVTGTLNMADLAARVGDASAENRVILEAGAAILGIAFLVKSGMWPLGFWLPTAYTAAAAPVAAIFAIMSKVGVYVVLRLSLLVFGPEAGDSAGFGAHWILVGGMVTIGFGMIGVLASQGLSRIAGYSVLVSSGTLLAVIGYGTAPVISGALYYLVSSTLTISAFFLLIELVERARDAGADVLAVTMEAFGEDEAEDAEEEVGVTIPFTLAVLGASFAGIALLLAGLPPLSGFLAKFAMIHGMFNPTGLGDGLPIGAGTWVLVALLIVSGLAALIAMTRSGISIFWASIERTVPSVRVIEVLPVLGLLGLCLAMTLQGGAVIRYMDETAASLSEPAGYIESVLTAERVARAPSGTPDPAQGADEETEVAP